MKINRNGAVLPPVYADRALRKTMGRRIAAATDDDLLAAFLRQEELCIVSDARNAARTEVERIQQQAEKAWGYVWRPNEHEHDWQTAQQDFTELCRYLGHDLNREVEAMEEIAEDLRALAIDLTSGFGPGLAHKYTEESRRSSPLDKLGELEAGADDVRARVRAHMEDAKSRIDELRAIDHRREEFMASEASISLDRIHRMDYSEFEDLAAGLLERDGLTIVRQRGGARDQGADVIAETACGHRVVVQCKHRKKGVKVDPQALYALNGTARQIHGADTVIAMTNRGFTQDASAFGHGQDIHLITGQVLTRWATWGDPIQEITGLPAPVAAITVAA